MFYKIFHSSIIINHRIEIIIRYQKQCFDFSAFFFFLFYPWINIPSDLTISVEIFESIMKPMDLAKLKEFYARKNKWNKNFLKKTQFTFTGNIIALNQSNQINSINWNCK